MESAAKIFENWNTGNVDDDYEPKCGDLVWASVPDYPAWPGEICVNPEKNDWRRKGKVWVKFFNDEEGAWCKEEELVRFEKDTIEDFLTEEDPDVLQDIQAAASMAYKVLKKRKKESKNKKKPEKEMILEEDDRNYASDSDGQSASSPTSVKSREVPARSRRTKDRKAAAPQPQPTADIGQLLASASLGDDDIGSRFSDKDEARLMTLTHTLAQKKRDLEHNLSKVVDTLHNKLVSVEEERGKLLGESDMFLAQASLVKKLFSDRASKILDSDNLDEMKKLLDNYEKLTDTMTHMLFESDHTKLANEEWRAKEAAVQATEEYRSVFKNEVKPLKDEYRSLRYKFQDFADFETTESVIMQKAKPPPVKAKCI
mmetsp:Transcript_12732/g.31401  ORF Transcript_12732/g.31401 Transcript_12732/m.31401 type:complete len:371 (+) Transcript_12732:1683-2795(+)|eukprot:CAMPEP_0198326196 /NCGR_PEP_ID=MMETSP1450-20131203/13788_1 /TAXON_ID=753684 ORGANISM="Madagascaria erythrocladiodes, Strain CCMP3234" /NCGR_SAMPLE_ID=MMETSP1450 /ASSEMBLY_ACC=CAM_ASM_001115 /LENGTH=370 /DNA_ID=CAMNT_0044030145 /DNA_START=1252 /DNA_END=2364 /DNA_ORIENTATION=-